MKRYKKAAEYEAKVTEFAPVANGRPVYYGDVYRLTVFFNGDPLHWELHKRTFVPEDVGDVETGPMIEVTLGPPELVAEGIGEPVVTDEWLENIE